MAKKNIFSILIIGIFLILGIILDFNEIFSRELETLNSKKDAEDIKINILNIKSRPQKGDNWIVNFETEGKADLKIIPGDEQTINDLEFVSLFCGEEKRMPQILQGDIIFYPDWFCDNASGSITHLVNVAGKHNLKFQFGNNIDYAFNSPDGWLGINGSHLMDFCGGDGLAEALDGSSIWTHDVEESHWFILDLGATYNITSVRGRSNDDRDPVDVVISVSNTTSDWGTPVATHISTWQDTDSWQEVDTTDKEGRYIYVGIAETEDSRAGISWGSGSAYPIFDVYEETEAVENILVGNQEWSTSSSWNYGSGTDLTSNASTSVELDLPKPTSRFVTSTDDIYWGIGIPSTTSLGVYSGTTTFEAKSD